MVYARQLARHGYRVETVCDAIEGLRLLQKKPFDLVISDISMPGMSGIELVEQLRASQNDVPVVLLTGAPHVDTAMRAVAQGVSRYLTKPVERQTLVDAASEAIRLHGVARAKRLALDNACLRSLVDELHRANTAAQAASRAKRRFLANMSHELRTPLAHILGYTELALEDEPSPERRQYLETSQRAASNLLTLIDSILQFSSLDGGTSACTTAAIATHALLAEATDPLFEAARRKGLSASLDIDASVPDALSGDALKLRQILEHIVGNAIKFTNAGGAIAIRVTTASVIEDATLLRFSVRDSGIGIPSAVRDRIFAAFSQADDSEARSHGGAGLGLTLAALLVQLLQGTIEIDSVPDFGTTVTFTARFGVRA